MDHELQERIDRLPDEVRETVAELTKALLLIAEQDTELRIGGGPSFKRAYLLAGVVSELDADAASLFRILVELPEEDA